MIPQPASWLRHIKFRAYHARALSLRRLTASLTLTGTISLFHRHTVDRSVRGATSGHLCVISAGLAFCVSTAGGQCNGIGGEIKINEDQCKYNASYAGCGFGVGWRILEGQGLTACQNCDFLLAAMGIIGCSFSKSRSSAMATAQPSHLSQCQTSTSLTPSWHMILHT
jgi:hypothetical protein